MSPSTTDSTRGPMMQGMLVASEREPNILQGGRGQVCLLEGPQVHRQGGNQIKTVLGPARDVPGPQNQGTTHLIPSYPLNRGGLRHWKGFPAPGSADERRGLPRLSS